MKGATISPVNLEEAKKAIYTLTYGVYLITTKRGEELSAMTAVWLTQISKEPLQVIVGMTPDSATAKMILESQVFAVNVLAPSQKDLALALGRSTSAESNKLDGLRCETRVTGSPILCDAVAYLDCRVVSQARLGTHLAITGEVVDGRRLHEEEPAVYRNGKIS